jgi:hypothetical protein
MSYKVAFFPLVTLLNRQFRRASPVIEVDVSFPVQFQSNEHCWPSNLGHDEPGTITVAVHNNSSLPYGRSHGADRRVAVRFMLGTWLDLYQPDNDNDNDNNNTSTTNSTTNPNTFEIELHHIAPHQSVNITIQVRLSEHVTLYDRATWRAELLLRDRQIQWLSHDIRCSPKFTINEQLADCLLIASRHFSRPEYECYHEMLDSMCLTYDIWDTERNDGISVSEKTGKRHNPTWYGKYKDRLIIFTLGSPDELRLFHARDLLDHLLLPGKGMDLQDRLHATVRLDERKWKQEWQRRNKIERAAAKSASAAANAPDLWNRDYTNYQSGMVIVGASPEQVRHYIMQWCSTNIRCTGGFFGGSHISAPSDDELSKKFKELERLLFMKDKNHLYSCLSTDVNLEKTGVFSWYVLPTTELPDSVTD